MDAVTQYLHAAGLSPRQQPFLESEFQLGHTIKNEQFSLTYRLEGERLVLCDLNAHSKDGQAVGSLVALLKCLLADVAQVQVIDAMILAAPHAPELNRARHKLAQLMVREGATPLDIDGMVWLRYRRH